MMIKADANEGSCGGREGDASVDKVPMCGREELLIALLRMLDHRRAQRVTVGEEKEVSVLLAKWLNLLVPLVAIH